MDTVEVRKEAERLIAKREFEMTVNKEVERLQKYKPWRRKYFPWKLRITRI